MGRIFNCDSVKWSSGLSSCVTNELTVMTEALGAVEAWGIVVIERACVCCVCAGEGCVLWISVLV